MIPVAVFVMTICSTNNASWRHLPDYISRAAAGEEIMVTRRGEVVVRLVAARDLRTTAREQLQHLRADAVVGDVVSPVDADWEAAG